MDSVWDAVDGAWQPSMEPPSLCRHTLQQVCYGKGDIARPPPPYFFCNKRAEYPSFQFFSLSLLLFFPHLKIVKVKDYQAGAV